MHDFRKEGATDSNESQGSMMLTFRDNLLGAGEKAEHECFLAKIDCHRAENAGAPQARRNQLLQKVAVVRRW